MFNNIVKHVTNVWWHCIENSGIILPVKSRVPLIVGSILWEESYQIWQSSVPRVIIIQLIFYPRFTQFPILFFFNPVETCHMFWSPILETCVSTIISLWLKYNQACVIKFLRQVCLLVYTKYLSNTGIQVYQKLAELWYT